MVVVGSACRDLVDDDPRGWRLGGGVSYTGLLLARLGIRTGVLIGVDGPASTASELNSIRDAGADVVAVPLEHGPVLVNVEQPGGRVQQCIERSDLVPVEALPDRWRSAGAWMLVPVAAELPDGWAGVPPPDAFVALGWQGLLRRLVAGEAVRRVAPGPSPVVSRGDLVGVSGDDVGDISAAALCAMLGPGATLAFTRGHAGGVALTAGADGAVASTRSWQAIAPSRSVDPTGAGDVFLGTMAAARIRPGLFAGFETPGVDLLAGAAAASLVLEDYGMLGVSDLGAIRARMAEALAAGWGTSPAG